MQKIILVHGAFSSPTSFNYFKHKLDSAYQTITFEYEVENYPVEELVDKLLDFVAVASSGQESKPILIGHSFGGVLCRAVASESPTAVEKIVTLASPHGGFHYPFYVEMVHANHFIPNTTSKNRYLSKIRRNKVTVPHLNIVAAHGHDAYFVPTNDNDLVVPVWSQSLDGVQNVMVDVNHFEVLLSDTVLQKVFQFIQKDKHAI